VIDWTAPGEGAMPRFWSSETAHDRIRGFAGTPVTPPSPPPPAAAACCAASALSFLFAALRALSSAACTIRFIGEFGPRTTTRLIGLNAAPPAIAPSAPCTAKWMWLRCSAHVWGPKNPAPTSRPWSIARFGLWMPCLSDCAMPRRLDPLATP
jgi:hypothetical protein